MTLTPQQRAAVEARGQDVCVVAGPGSGKTRVLIERFRWLVETGKLDPRRILAITFTDKAATEIKKRLVDSFSGSPNLRTAIERAWVSTVHGFCARLLKDHAIVAGVDPEFKVLDEHEARSGLKDTAVEELDRLLIEDGGRLRGLLSCLYVSSDPNGRQPDLAQALIAVYEAMRVAGKEVSDLGGAPVPVPGATLEEVRAAVRRYLDGAGAGGSEAHRRRVDALQDWLAAGEEPFRALASFPCTFRGLRAGNPYYDAMKPLREEVIPAAKAALIAERNAPLYELLVDAVRRIDAAWRRYKREQSALDFADLEEAAIRLLREEPVVADRVRCGFDAILMDELQDTNPLQWTLVDLLRRPERFFAVGDVNQSIFGFRHAEPSVYRKYRDSIAAAGKPVHELWQNYRSRDGILDAVNAVFATADGVESHALIGSDKFAADAGPVVERIVATAVTSAEAQAIEAAWIARRILALKRDLTVGPKGAERPAEFSDFAVLGRSLNALEPVRLALAQAHIPALVSGGRTFFEAREVRDLTLWLTALANPRDEIALAGLLRSPLAGIGDETMLRLCATQSLADAFEHPEPAAIAALDAEERARLAELRERFDRLRPMRDAISPERLTAAALDGVDYLSALTPHGRANVEKFMALLRDRFGARPRTLRETLEDLELLRGAASEPEAPPGESSNAVRLMSIHKSKGLEFPVVFVPALQRGTDRTKPVICFDPAAGIGVRWRDPAGGGGIADTTFERFAAEREAKERAEENRLLYVAMTRAEERLILSYSDYQKSAWVELVCGARAAIPALSVTAMPESWVDLESAVEADAETVLPRPEVSGQYDSIMPVTSVSGFRACPRRYYLGRYIGWSGRSAPARPPVDEDWRETDLGEIDAGELGRQTHALLAGESVKNPHPEAVDLVRAFERTDLGARVRRASRLGRETAFLCTVDDVVLRGQIDLWFEEGGELILVDYKTDRITAADEGRLEPYRLQVQLYALALERMTGRVPERGFLQLLRTGESVSIDLSPARLDAARAAVAELRDAQERLEFPLREGKHCLTCEFFRGICPAGRSPEV